MTSTTMNSLRHAHSWAVESDWSLEIRARAGNVLFNALMQVLDEGLRELYRQISPLQSNTEE